MKYYAGIDLGGTNIKSGIVRETGEIISKASVPTGADREPSLIVKDMAKSLEMAAEAYKESLRNNPNDHETRYNLAVVLHQLKQNQQNQQNQQDNQQQENKQDQQQQQQNKEQQQNEQQNKEQQQNEQQNQQQEQQQAQAQQQEQEMSKENAERLLEAAMQDEKAVLEKVKREENKASKGKLEKNW